MMRSRKKKKKKELMRKFKEEKSWRVCTLVIKKLFKIDYFLVIMKKNNIKSLIQYLPGILILIYVFFLAFAQFIK